MSSCPPAMWGQKAWAWTTMTGVHERGLGQLEPLKCRRMEGTRLMLVTLPARVHNPLLSELQAYTHAGSARGCLWMVVCPGKMWQSAHTSMSMLTMGVCSSWQSTLGLLIHPLVSVCRKIIHIQFLVCINQLDNLSFLCENGIGKGRGQLVC